MQVDAVQLHPFEKGAIGNLMPDTIEEAKALIPSLNNGVESIRADGIEDDRLQELLDQLNVLRQQEQ